jgi:hypothetical protein
MAGPAGATFEAQVGAFYLLALLANTEARGLPGAKMMRVGFQKAPEGLELDDVVVYGVQDDGASATLEIQVKRSIRFTSGDSVWKKVVGQIAGAASKDGFWLRNHQFAVAVAKTTAKIDGPYQDVLMWARDLGSASAFFTRLRIKGVANDAMRDFVQDFKKNLSAHGHQNDEETIWRLLRRLQILTFDFTAKGSICQELSRDRAARLLDPARGERGSQLWDALVVSALSIASLGGDRDRSELFAELSGKYHFQSDRETRACLERLNEAALSGLSDIDHRIGNASLARSDYLEKLREHLDNGRYIEIRGESGTGKSAILRQVADQIRAESRIVYLSPHRTVPGGWLAFQAVLKIDLGLKELLSELASNGGAIIFVDNLDFFAESAQATVKDVIRHAAIVPGVSVVVTCRKSFGEDVPSWLPRSAINDLGGVRVVEVTELTDDELAELSASEPKLAPLLSSSGLARPIIANLFRLSRLARSLGSETPTTEASMANQWWRSSDNIPQEFLRDGRRILCSMAEHFLAHNQPFDARQINSRVVDELVKVGSLQELTTDEVVFKHDVLRDWAIANFLFERSSVVASLNLTAPLRSSILRTIDLLARLMIEGASDPDRYFALLANLSKPSAHGSWRRPVLLALVKSEISETLLELCRTQLLSDRARLLSELIRTLMAVEVQPAPKFFEGLGLNVSNMVDGIKLPIGPAWRRLIVWLLRQSESELSDALQDAIDLFATWAFSTLGEGEESQAIVAKFNAWLIAIETSRHAKLSRDSFSQTPPLAGAIHREILIRRCFLRFAGTAAAKHYLEHVRTLRNNDDIAREVLKHSGMLARTAPAELASFTVNSLLSVRGKRAGLEDDGTRALDDPLTFLDNAFIPAAPTQGPFLLLLINAPANGLSAIRRIVDHIVDVKTAGRDPGLNSVTLRLGSVIRRFGWRETYLWSHGNHDAFSAVSALMALEAWGHRRIESGESVRDVLTDVLGAGDQPMCYLAVAVDLILSHWTEAAAEAIPFLGSPDLLVLDRERQVFDNFGGGSAASEGGAAKQGLVIPGYDTAETLRKRPSRSWTLLQRLYECAFAEDNARRESLVAILDDARNLLGPYDKNANFGDPAFVASHAINALDKSNWEIAAVSGGQQLTYIGPENERLHLEALNLQAQSLARKSNLEAAIAAAVENPSRSSESLARAGVDWAKAQGGDEEPDDPTHAWVHKLMITRCALVAMRDGDVALRQTNHSWAVSILHNASETDSQDRLGSNSQFQYSHSGMALLGFASALNVRRWEGDVGLLLKLCQAHSTGPAKAFSRAIDVLLAIDARLPKSMLRVALAAQVHLKFHWEDEGASRGDRVAEHEAKRLRCIESELLWLSGKGEEPKWPTFPNPIVREDSRIIQLPFSRESGVSESESEADQSDPRREYVDIHGARCWLNSFAEKAVLKVYPWIIDLVRQYRPWTLRLNGVGLKPSFEIASDAAEWNEPYFDLVFKASGSFAYDEIESWLTPIFREVPDDNLYRALRTILFKLDQAYFGSADALNVDAVAIRAAAADRLLQTSNWKWRSKELALEIDLELGGAVSALFFSTYILGARSLCYLTPISMDKVGPFIPTLTKIVSAGAFGFVAIAALNFLEVEPDRRRLSFAVDCLRSWLGNFGENTGFWVDLGVGARICNVIAKMRRFTGDEDLDAEVAVLLPNLVKLGITEAKDLEEIVVGS